MSNVIKTNSATPLDRVTVIPDFSGMKTHVWLRKNIEQTNTNETLSSNEDASQNRMGMFYTADELYLVLPGSISVEQVTSNFDEIWDEYSQEESLDERVTRLEHVVSSVTSAISLDI